MTLVVATEPASLVAVNDQCETVERWAATCNSVPELEDASNRLAAVDHYLKRTSTEGRARVAAAMRRLEVRIGQLLPPKGEGRGRRTDLHETSSCMDEEVGLNKDRRAEFRQMAEHPEVVEQVIAESTDAKPASRRSVVDRIKQAKANHPVTPPRNLPLAERTEQIRSLASRNYTSPQIADEIGTSPHNVRAIARRVGVAIPADAVFNGKFRKIDPNKVIDSMIDQATPDQVVLALVAYSELDRDRLDEWVSSLSDAISALSKIRSALKKELTRDQS